MVLQCEYKQTDYCPTINTKDCLSLKLAKVENRTEETLWDYQNVIFTINDMKSCFYDIFLEDLWCVING